MGITEFLQSQHIPFETLLHQPAPSATKLAHSVHVPGRRVAKTVLVKAGRRYVLAVLPATHRVDFQRLAAIVDTASVRLATEDEVEQIFVDCERGALPPFGRRYGLQTVVDSSLAGGAEIVIEGNLRHLGVRIRFEDFEAIEAPLMADFAEPIAPKRSAFPERRVG